MESLRPIFWGQGMFLQPQHFQQQDAYHEARLRRYLHLLYPFCWGIKSLAINETALRNFVFEVERCELVTWHGTIITFQGETFPSNARLVPRSFEGALDPGGRPLEVFLGLKRVRWEEANIGSQEMATGREAEGEGLQRFSIREAVTPDLFGQDNRGSALKYLVHEVQLFFGDDSGRDQDYETMKIAEVLRSAEGQGAVLSKRYIPPSLSVHASPVLDGMLRELRDLLTAKGRELAEYKRQRRIHTIDISSRDTVYLLRMQLVNRYIPLFHHHLEVEETHPCVLYALLRQLVGELSTFSETVSALGGPLPTYRHDRLWECFDAAVQMAKDLLKELTGGPEYMVQLVFDGEYFAAHLDKGFFEGNKHYYLSINIDMSPSELLHRLTETGKICSREGMEWLRGQSVSGLKIDYRETPPEELPRRLNSKYFEIDHRTRHWRDIARDQNIAVYCDLPPEKSEIHLLVIPED
jgi:type VI secretion system protein ImpJ